ncbi:hypothetical protein PG994_004639 [Apiospora phragmitis]|uniref:Secreted protein n=1 Tax=Apiospora phragmitis TaxID=2905665 RepID=A0ABR1VR53_9PEZI
MLSSAVTTALCLLVAGAAAGGSGGDFVDEVRSDFKMGLFPRQQALQDNIQPFSGKVGGFSAAAITQSQDKKRPFTVKGDTFTDFKTAANRACDNQKNDCANAANKDKNAGFKVSDCDKQNSELSIHESFILSLLVQWELTESRRLTTDDCKDAVASATLTSFAVLTSSTAEFDIFCES